MPSVTDPGASGGPVSLSGCCLTYYNEASLSAQKQPPVMSCLNGVRESEKGESHCCVKQEIGKLDHTILTQFSTDPRRAAALPSHWITRASILTMAGEAAVPPKGAFGTGCEGTDRDRSQKGDCIVISIN